MLETELTVALYQCSLVEQGQRANEILWLSQESHMSEDWSVIAAPIVLMATVLLDYHWTI